MVRDRKSVVDADALTLARAADLERRFRAGIYPTGAGQAAQFRKLARRGMLRFDDVGRDD